MDEPNKLWFEKYRPDRLEDISISPQKVEFLLKWFKDFKEGKTDFKALLFIGPPGLGKTSLAHVILKHAGYSVKEFNASDIRSKKLINSTLDNLMNNQNITQLTDKTSDPLSIIMDEVDGMCKGDRGGLEELLSFIPGKRKKQVGSNNTRIPIICICNTGNIKLEMVKQLKTKCTEINFTLPTTDEMFDVFAKISENESISYDSEATAQEIIKYAQFDFRRMTNILEYLVNRYGSNITLDHVHESYESLCQKEQDLHITDSVKKIINYEMTYDEITNIYNRDKSKATMVIHENYPKSVRAQKTTMLNKIHNAIQCINSIVESDIVEKTIYNTQGWHLQTIQGISCAYIPNYYMNCENKTTTVPAKWTCILPTNSHSQHLQKKMHELIFQINRKYSYSISDIQALCNMILICMNNNKVDEAVQLLLNYGIITDEDILSKKKTILIVTNLMKYIKLDQDADSWIANSEIESQFNRAIDKYKKLQVTEVRCGKTASVTKESVKIKKKTDEVASETAKPVIAAKETNPIKAKISIQPKNKSQQTELVKQRKAVTIRKLTKQ